MADCESCPEKHGFFQEWSCLNCPELKPEEINPESWRLLEIRRLQIARYPFSADDLDYATWQALAGLEEKIEMEKRKREWELLLLKKGRQDAD